MKTIWKFELLIVDEQEVMLPKDSIILSSQFQRGKLFIWAIVDTDKPRELITIVIIGTGNPFWCDDWKFISTVQGGGLVWHVFQKPQ